MKLPLLLLNLVAITLATIATNADWQAYKRKYNKMYSTYEDSRRRLNFNNNKLYINLHNLRAKANLVSYNLDENQYTDMSKIQFFEMLGGKNYATNYPPPPSLGTPVVLKKLAEDPSSYRNWTRDGAGYGIQDQGTKCNAAWAFAAVSVIEAHAFQVAEKPMLPEQLSVQNLIDCAGGSTACNGLQAPQTAYNYIEFEQNINTVKNYNYTGEQTFCKYNPNDVGIAIGGFQKIDEDKDEDLFQIVAYETPVVIGFNPFSFEFMHYKSGIFVPPRNTINIYYKYYMTVIGFGKDNGQEYWLLKNSMGYSWGESGYMKMIRRKDYPISKYATFANV